jgi:putative endonuclease
VGISNDVERRGREHSLGSSIRTTRIFGFSRVLYVEHHPTLAAARQREQQLKRWSAEKKRALIAGSAFDLRKLAKRRTPNRGRR